MTRKTTYKKLTSLLLTVVMVLALVPAQIVPAQAATGWQPVPDAGKTLTSKSSWPVTLTAGTWMLDGETHGPIVVDFRNQPGKSPITLANDAWVYLIIKGDVTLYGANASGTTGATAAINIPESSVLFLYSAHDEELSTSTEAPKDTLTVYGGNAAAGVDGVSCPLNIEKWREYETKGNKYYSYEIDIYCGAGGNGGGGAAAAIGGNGGNGGAGGKHSHDWPDAHLNIMGIVAYTYLVEEENGQVTNSELDDFSGTTYVANNMDDPGENGAAGAKGSQGSPAGNIFIFGRLQLNATGGSAAGGGKGGDGGEAIGAIEKLVDHNNTDKSHDVMIGGNGGGGGGGGGCGAPAIGAGGAGGSGGGGGGHGTVEYNGWVNGSGGGGGAGGWPNGGGGGGGACISSHSNDNDVQDYKKTLYTSGKGGKGGRAGTVTDYAGDGKDGEYAYAIDKTDTDVYATPGEGGGGAAGESYGSPKSGPSGVPQDEDTFRAGSGGNSGGTVEKKTWNPTPTVSTATSFNLRGGNGADRLFGDGGGYGGPKDNIANIDVVYDLMDCKVVDDYGFADDEVYNEQSHEPSIGNMNIQYSAETDRDGAMPPNGKAHGILSSSYTATEYGENICCPEGTVTLVSTIPKEEWLTTRTDGAVIGHKRLTFAIKKATLTPRGKVTLESTDNGTYYVGETYSASFWDGYYFSDGNTNLERNLHQLHGSDGTETGPVITFKEAADGNLKIENIQYDSSNKTYRFDVTPLKEGSFPLTMNLSGMHDFNDASIQTATVTARELNLMKDLKLEGIPHYGQTLSVSGVPTDAKNVKYQWGYMRSSQLNAISDATDSTYLVKPGDVGSVLGVTVTADGYDPTTVTTNQTASSHSYTDNGFCKVDVNGTPCGEYEMPTTSTGVYQIKNTGNLYWYAAYMNGDSTHAHLGDGRPVTKPTSSMSATLVADIDLEGDQGRIWKPISGFWGTLDGNGHTISNMKVNEVTADGSQASGFIATTQAGSTIRKLKLQGTIDITSANARVGGVVGHCYGTTLSDLQVDVNINTTDNTDAVGGIVGRIAGDSATSLKKCLYYGTINHNGTTSSNYTGGIVGTTDDPGGSITYCAFWGKIYVRQPSTSGESRYAGGLVGGAGSNKIILKNSYSYGIVSLAGSPPQTTLWQGELIGRVVGNVPQMADLCYVKGKGSPFGTQEGVTIDTSVYTAAQAADFTSGRVCYLVNEAGTRGTANSIWRQNVDNGQTPDPYPLFHTTDNSVVYYRSDDTYSNIPEQIDVDITWGPMTFEYSTTGWDAADHTYKDSKWTNTSTSPDAGKLTVTNKSNVDVKVDIGFTAEEKFASYGLTGTFTGDTSKRVAKDNGNAEATLSITSTKNPFAVGTDIEAASQRIGGITVTIGAAGPAS